LVCACAERRLLDQELLDRALRGDGVTVVQDLCACAAHRDPLLREFARQPSPKVFACHPRAVRALFVQSGAPLSDDVEIVNIGKVSGDTPDNPRPVRGWPPWFPVIDKQRCINCGQCLDFCLFGVYEKDESGQVRVVNPSNCKNNCPACARICPEAAIIFPKCGEPPINGAEIDDAVAVRANIKLNIDEMLGDDVYGALNARKQKRRHLLDEKKIEKALAERDRWETNRE